MDELFDLPTMAARQDADPPAGRARPRIQRPDRDQVELRPTHLDALLPPDHRARAVWDFVEGLDLSALHARIRAVEGHPGRPPIDPAILLALWPEVPALRERDRARPDRRVLTTRSRA